MSKAEKSLKATNNSQLKSDLGQAVKVLHGLLSGLDKIEAALLDSDKALDAENRYKEQLSKQEKRIQELQNNLEAVDDQREKEVTSFATANLKLNEDFHARIRKQSFEFKSRLDESQKREVSNERRWKEIRKSETGQIDRIKASERVNQRQYETRLKQIEELAQTKEDALQEKLQETERRAAELLERNQTLIEETAQLYTIQKGRETEMNILMKKLTALEAFSPKSQEEISTHFASLQDKLQEFCGRCVESAEIWPSWNQLPEGFQQKGFPRYYSMDSAAGRYILFAAIQHSVCAAMVENIFTSLGINPSQELGRISKALYQKNRSHEAIWRLAAANTILGDQQVLGVYQQRLRNIADALLTYWKLFQSGGAKDEFLNMLSTILFDAFQTWWCLMKFRDKISSSIDGPSRFFEPDSGDRSVEMPGDFTGSDSTSAACLFPALLEVTLEDRSERPQLLRKGTVMYSNSPNLLLALKEEQQMTSPRLSNKKVSRTTG